MKSFWPMERREGATLVFLIAFAAFAFIPAWRTIEFGGMAAFGWLIAALMLVSPAVTLVAFLRRDGAGGAAAEGSGGTARARRREAEAQPSQGETGDSVAGVETDGGES